MATESKTARQPDISASHWQPEQ